MDGWMGGQMDKWHIPQDIPVFLPYMIRINIRYCPILKIPR